MRFFKTWGSVETRKKLRNTVTSALQYPVVDRMTTLVEKSQRTAKGGNILVLTWYGIKNQKNYRVDRFVDVYV